MPLQFFQSYLSNRKQYVFCNNTSSYNTTNGYGIPQSSVLGLLLFIIYVNYIMNAVNDSKILIFADDTALFIQWKDIPIIFNRMKKCLVKLMEWFSCNRLTLNLTKTCYSIFHGRKKQIPRMYDKMTINGNAIHRENKYKYLGLIIDKKLSWRDHTDYLIASLSTFYGISNKIRHLVPKQHKLTIYKTYVLTKTRYRIEIYGSLNETLSNDAWWCMMMYDEVYITIGVYIFIRKILWSCTVVFYLWVCLLLCTWSEMT